VTRRWRERDSNPRSPHEKGLVLRSPRSTAWAKPTITSRDDPSRWLPDASRDEKPIGRGTCRAVSTVPRRKASSECQVLCRSSLEPERLHDARGGQRSLPPPGALLRLVGEYLLPDRLPVVGVPASRHCSAAAGAVRPSWRLAAAPGSTSDWYRSGSARPDVCLASISAQICWNRRAAGRSSRLG
jgi:hypothetical protein